MNPEFADFHLKTVRVLAKKSNLADDKTNRVMHSLITNIDAGRVVFAVDPEIAQPCFHPSANPASAACHETAEIHFPAKWPEIASLEPVGQLAQLVLAASLTNSFLAGKNTTPAEEAISLQRAESFCQTAEKKLLTALFK